MLILKVLLLPYRRAAPEYKSSDPSLRRRFDGTRKHYLLQRRKNCVRAEAAMRDDFVWEEVRSFFHLPTFDDITHSTH